MKDMGDGSVLACDEVPTDTIQVHANPTRASVWIETNTKYANTRTTISLTRDGALTLLADLRRALLT